MEISTEKRLAKLRELAGAEGCDSPEGLIAMAQRDCVCPGICVLDGCSYTVEVEPDQTEGYCEACGTPTVQSALILAECI